MASAFFAQGAGLGLFADHADPCHAEIAIEVGDRLFEKAFEDENDGNELILDEARKVVTAYLELYASPAGRAGVGAASRASASARRT